MRYRIVYRWDDTGPHSKLTVVPVRPTDEEGLAAAEKALGILTTPPTVVAEARIERLDGKRWSPVA